LGFWHSKEVVKEILTDILNIIRKSDEITSYAEVMIESKENLLMIDCKLECLNIIDLIAEYDGDVFVQFIAARFRDF
jgi:two-component SAPR family response regulator